MADHVPFITGQEGVNLVAQLYADSEVVRVPLDQANTLVESVHAKLKARIWIDPCVDGMDDAEKRRLVRDKKGGPQRESDWFRFMREAFPRFQEIAEPSFHAKPDKGMVAEFVEAIMEKCVGHKPAWITVPQLPLATGSERNRINRALATATGNWVTRRPSRARLILPLVFTHQDQLNGKEARTKKLEQAVRCYDKAGADGVWAVDQTLADDSGSPTLRNKRLPGVIGLHKELNDRIDAKLKIAGPYWGLNLILWSRGLVSHPAIGIGSGYQYMLAGGKRGGTTVTRVAIASLRRRVVHSSDFRKWMESTYAEMEPWHPAHADLHDLRARFTALGQPDQARAQVAAFYKAWYETIAAAPRPGRPVALFQDLSAAYMVGRPLRELDKEQAGRRPEAVVEQFLLSCL